MNPIETLKYHNKWRRNGEGEMCNPAELGVAIDTVIADYEVMQKQNDELRAKIADIQSKWEFASSDISSLFKTQPMNQNDGSFAIDGQSCHDLFTAIVSTPAQSLADIRAEAVMDFMKDSGIEESKLSGVKFKLGNIYKLAQDYANRIKEG